MAQARIDCRSNEWIRYQNKLNKSESMRQFQETAEYIKRLQIQIDSLEKRVKELEELLYPQKLQRV